MIKSLRGMNDILSEDYERFTHFIDVASSVAQRYGYHFIETPLLEETSLFKRSVGESSDIVGKEMYQFIDKGENDVCLRPEGTAGVVRAFIQKKLDKAGGTHRFFYHGPMFRYERPQKGRLREFHQFGVESFGVENRLAKGDAMTSTRIYEKVHTLDTYFDYDTIVVTGQTKTYVLSIAKGFFEPHSVVAEYEGCVFVAHHLAGNVLHLLTKSGFVAGRWYIIALDLMTGKTKSTGVEIPKITKCQFLVVETM